MSVPLAYYRSVLLFSTGLLKVVLCDFLFAPASWAQSMETEQVVQAPNYLLELVPIGESDHKGSNNTREIRVQGVQLPLLYQAATPPQPTTEILLDRPSTQAADLLPETQDFQQANSLMDTVAAVQFADPSQAIAIEEQFAQVQAAPTDLQNNSFSFGFDTHLFDPTALRGSIRTRPARTLIKSTGLAVPVSLNQGLGNGNALNLVVEGGEHIVAFDLGFTSATDDPRRGFGVNLSSQQSWFPAFRGGDNELDLPNGNTPWIDRLAGGVEVFLPLGSQIDSAIGVSYQRVTVRDQLFTSKVFASDEDGNSLTVDDDGVDDYVTVNFAALLDRRDDRTFPTNGFIARAGVDQGFKISGDELAYTRLSGSFIQYLPVNFIGFAPGPRTVILQLQAGTILGEVPPYEAFTIGGDNSVRGFDGGGVGTGSSFIQAAAEYRFPITSLAVFSRNIRLRGALFVDYGTDLGTADEVIGRPAEVRDKPGDGFGFGVGLNAESPFGLGRLEFAISDDGDSQVIVTIGDRF